MSRIFYASLRAAAVCTLSLSFALPTSAGQKYLPPEEETAEEDSGNDTMNELLDRLDRQDAELRALKRQFGAIQVQNEVFAGDDIPANEVSTSSDGSQLQIASLSQRLDELTKKVTGKNPPYIEMHAVSQMDSSFWGQDAKSIKTLGTLDNGSDFRRTRLGANGALTDNMNYFFQMDFSFPGRPTFTDVWMELTKLPVIGSVRAGQWKMPFSLEVVSSFRYTTFAERSVLFQSFAPFRHIGVGFYNSTEDERMTWAGSAYRAGQDQFGDALTYGNTGNYAVVGRMTGLAWYENEGASYLHLGAGYNWVAPQSLAGTNTPTASFGTIPEYFTGQNTTVTTGTAGVSQPTSSIDGTPKFVNTKNFAVNHYNLVGGELLWVEGPLSVQSEFNLLEATRPTGVGATFGGFYTTFGYFLTGEHRPYLKKAGAIDRIKVLHNFIKGKDDDEWGLGAWELAWRWSYIDLNSRDIQGGRLNDMTCGLNWYLNSYAKLQFNYIRSYLNNPTFGKSYADIVGLRAQFDY